ncbi:MAG: DUF4388 domain-containing protein [Methylacidiphilales bacterium]|nr:DUF4388 domain-containing protein [Candidatus Methylacidiphilales bacterium]
MKIGLAVGSKNACEWFELGLSSIPDLKVVSIETCDLDLPPDFDLILMDADHPGPSFIAFYRNFIALHKQRPLVILGQPSSPALMRLDWDSNLAIFIAKPYQIQDVIETISQKTRQITSLPHAPEVKEKSAASSSGTAARPLGYLSTLRLPDLIQMLCLSNWTGKIEITNLTSNETGEIYLNVGVMIHASQDKTEAETAVYRMLPWGRCEFNFIEEHPPVIQTIRSHWQEIMLEGARRVDESRMM